MPPLRWRALVCSWNTKLLSSALCFKLLPLFFPSPGVRKEGVVTLNGAERRSEGSVRRGFLSYSTYLAKLWHWAGFWWRHWWFGGNVMPWWPWLWLKPPFSGGLNHSLTISCTFRHQAAMGVWEDGSFFLVFVFICASFCGCFCLFVCFHLVKAVTLH